MVLLLALSSTALSAISAAKNSGSTPGDSEPGPSSATSYMGNFSPGVPGVVYPLSGVPLDGISRQPLDGLSIRSTGGNDPDSHCEWYYKYRPVDTVFLGPAVVDISDQLTELENPFPQNDDDQEGWAVSSGHSSSSGPSKAGLSTSGLSPVAKDFDIIQLSCHKVKPSSDLITDF